MKDQQPTSGITDWGQTPLRVASVPCDTAAPLQQLAAHLGAEPMELVLLFISPDADVQALARDVPVAFGQTPMIGCTTAGELTDAGYAEGQIVAIGLPKSLFCNRTQLIENLSDVDTDALVRRMLRNRDALRREAEAFRHEFNFLIVDGLSQREDALTAALSLGLGPVPLFGGSAGDGADFGAAFVLWQGQLYRNAAVLTQIRSRCPVRVFKSDHLVPSGRKMVVTSARPQERLVQEINAEPAAREYARLLGKDPEQLDTFTFAAHPVVVQIGDQHHVRSIQRVAENGDLVFFSAIDEGVVLTLADSLHMVDHLEAQFADLSRDGVPEAILACDCLLRKLEAEQKQMIGQLSEVMVQNRVVGFSTYGEQLNSMHVNQTLTGVAFYPPDPLNDTAEEDLA
ncbi:FIST N-terminal domain-containing protein [Thalassovita sp.]|uniref:FIST N-terminal domain-containing protein n=1 Tax=Thalassovita sp. TaxID=1979401 RepID=UPI002AB25D41|nr:FIST N-terminal domain-containing protein [Thalassovita sp.]